MQQRTRTLLFLFFVVLFFTITPAMILYASGYVINFSTFRLEKTGYLVIKTEPEGAEIILDNKLKVGFLNNCLKSDKVQKTPAKLRDLFPGEYELAVQLDGYWPWKRKVSIFPNQTTFLNDIHLLKKNAPIRISNSGAKKIIALDNKTFLLAGSILQIYGKESGKLETIGSSTPSTPVDAATSGKSVLSADIIYRFDGPKETVKLPVVPSLARWDNTSDDLYYKTFDAVWRMPAGGTDPVKALEREGLSEFKLISNRFIAIFQTSTSSVLSIYDKRNFEVLYEAGLPKGDYLISSLDDNLIALHDAEKQILYTMDLKAEFTDSERLSPVVQFVYLSEKGLLYRDNYEIWIYDASENKKTIIARLSEPIIDINWHPNGKYVFFSNKDGISIIDLQNDNSINQLISIGEADTLTFDKEGKTLYYSGMIGERPGVYALGI